MLLMMMQIRSSYNNNLFPARSDIGRSAKKTNAKENNGRKNKRAMSSSSSRSLSSKKNEFVPSFREALTVNVKIIDVDILKRFTRERREQERNNQTKTTKTKTKRKDIENKKTTTKNKDTKAVVSVPSSRGQSSPTPSSITAAWLSYYTFGAAAVTTVAAGVFFFIFGKSEEKGRERNDDSDDPPVRSITYSFDTPQTAAVRNNAPRPPRQSKDRQQREQREILWREDEDVNPFLKQMKDPSITSTPQQLKDNTIPRPRPRRPPPPTPQLSPPRSFENEPSAGKISSSPSSTDYVVPKQVEEEIERRRGKWTVATFFDGEKVNEIKKEFNQWVQSYDDELHPWNQALDNERYDAITNSSLSTKEDRRNPHFKKVEKEKKVREAARRRRNSYFAAVSSNRYATTTKELLDLEEKVRERLASNTPVFDTEGTFFKNESRKEAMALYGIALGKLFYEKSPTTIVGEGTFSDVFSAQKGTASAPSSPSLNKADFFTQGECVLKCSAPFPGRDPFDAPQGDGYGFGKVETMVLTTLPKHPAIVEVIAAFLEADRNESYLLLKDVGENAHEARKKGRLTPRECRAMARRILHALKHCHERNVIHRDIKSGNILIKGREGSEDFDRKATLVDFGVAHSQTACELYFPETVNNEQDDSKSLAGKITFCSVEYDPSSGTPGYQAPEVLLGKYTPPAKKQGEIVNDDEVENSNDIVNNGKVSMETYAKVDIFAFGVAMYFLCTGKEIFADSSDAGENTTTKSKQKARAMSAMELKRLNRKELDLDAKILTQMLTYPDFRLASSQEKNMRERYGNLVKNQNEVIQSTTLTEKIIEDLSGRQPVAFCKLIASCLNVDPSKRPSAEEALAWENAFVGIDRDEDIRAFEKTPWMMKR